MNTISFNELRRIKDALPDGAMEKIATALSIEPDTVRNYFGGTHYNEGEGKPQGFHLEPGPDGGIVMLDDTTILELARKTIAEQ